MKELSIFILCTLQTAKPENIFDRIQNTTQTAASAGPVASRSRKKKHVNFWAAEIQ